MSPRLKTASATASDQKLVKPLASDDPVKAPEPSPTGAVESPKTGDGFGEEGTNKTVAKPKPDNEPSDELGLTPHIEKSPYTRG